MIASPQIANIEIFAFITVLVPETVKKYATF